MITKIANDTAKGILSKETFDKRKKFDKNSKTQDLLGGLGAVGLSDAATRVAVNASPLEKFLATNAEKAVANKPGQDLIRGAYVDGFYNRPDSSVYDNPVVRKVLKNQNFLKVVPAMTALSTYKATREKDRDPANNDSWKWYASSAALSAPSIARIAENMDALNRGISLGTVAQKAALKKARPWLLAETATRELLPYFAANAAGYGVAKLQDKTIDAYNKFQDKRYADTEAILKARRKAKEKK